MKNFVLVTLFSLLGVNSAVAETALQNERFYAEMSCGPSPSIKSGDLLKAYFPHFSSGRAVTKITGEMHEEELEWRILSDGAVSVEGDIFREGRFDGRVNFSGSVNSHSSEISGSIGDRKCRLDLWSQNAPMNPMGALQHIDGETLKSVLSGNTAKGITWADYFAPDGSAEAIVKFYGADITDRYTYKWSTNAERFCGVTTGKPVCNLVFGSENEQGWRMAWQDHETGAVWVADIVEGKQLQ